LSVPYTVNSKFVKIANVQMREVPLLIALDDALGLALVAEVLLIQNRRDRGDYDR